METQRAEDAGNTLGVARPITGGSAVGRVPGRRQPIPEACWVPGALVLGVLVGLVLPPQETKAGQSALWQHVSAVTGWTYFCAWTVSFYPQLFLNWARQSVVGLSMDYQMLNLVGFSVYFAFNAMLYWDPHVKEEYRQQHDGKDSAVRLNDVLFAGHAALITMATMVQIGIYYDYPPLAPSEKLLRIVVLTFLGAVLVVAAVFGAIIVADSEDTMTWLTYLGALAEVKVVISFCKYCPQVWMNYRRKSTEGWNIHNVLLDFFGGMLSVAQLVLDAWSTSDWSAVSGDPVKLLLGNLSMIFDVIFMTQHYCLYRQASVRGGSEACRSLLPGETGNSRRCAVAAGA